MKLELLQQIPLEFIWIGDLLNMTNLGIWLIANLGQGEPAPATYISSVFTFAERSLVVAIFNLSYVGFELERLVVLGWDSQYDIQKATNCFDIFTTVWVCVQAVHIWLSNFSLWFCFKLRFGKFQRTDGFLQRTCFKRLVLWWYFEI